MSQNQGLQQIQKEQQLQKLSPQQLLVVELTELPIDGLEMRVKNELDDNFVLEEAYDKRSDDDLNDDGIANGEDESNDEFDNDEEMFGRNADETGDYSSDDDIPGYLTESREFEPVELPIGDTSSFVDDLLEQMVDFNLTEHQQQLVEYLVGSLNESGFIDQKLSRIADEMTFKHGIDTDEYELEEALAVLQQFEPAGIGARDTRECLLLQIDRKMAQLPDSSVSRRRLLELERRIIADEFDAFKNSNVDRLQKRLGIDATQLAVAFEGIKKLSIHPGLALCESASDRAQTVVPDFIIETDVEGKVSFVLNKGEIPALQVNSKYLELEKQYLAMGDKMRKRDKESYEYNKKHIERAQMFIEAIKTRHQTLTSTMKAITELQHDYFVTLDEDDLHDMILKDVAERAGLDASTVSRVCKTKYALVDGRVRKLSFFFKHSRANKEGESVDSDNVRKVLTHIIESEDKNHPFSDSKLVEELKKHGINIRLRTVNKYRNEFGIPPARSRAID